MGKDKTYQLADGELRNATDPELRAIGFLSYMPRSRIRAQWTGEKRKPRKGEWFLSGAIVEAYKATNDIDTVYHIAKLVLCEQVWKVVS